jgi:hypothetical protein
MERADADLPGAPPRQAQPVRAPDSAPTCRSGSTQFHRRAALVQKRFGFQRCLTKPRRVKAFARFVRSSPNGPGGKSNRESERFCSVGSLFQNMISEIRMIVDSRQTLSCLFTSFRFFAADAIAFSPLPERSISLSRKRSPVQVPSLAPFLNQ